MSAPNTATYNLLVLSKLRGVGSVTLNQLVSTNNGQSLHAMSTAHSTVAKALDDTEAMRMAQVRAERDVERAEHLNLRILSPYDPEYPRLLLPVSDRPAIIYAKGSPDALRTKAVAVVGTREPTEDGKRIAHRISKYFAESGWAVVSGLALGIDAVAHTAAVEAEGCTVAVLAHGLDMVAPKKHAGLAERILESGGALVSEYAPGVRPFGPQFVRRDRVQAGLALGVILVQTGISGGSLHASRAVLEYGRLLAYPVPTPKDIGAGEPKTEGILKIHRGTSAEVSQYLKCRKSDLSSVIALDSRDSYPALANRMLTLSETRVPEGTLELFGPTE